MTIDIFKATQKVNQSRMDKYRSQEKIREQSIPRYLDPEFEQIKENLFKKHLLKEAYSKIKKKLEKDNLNDRKRQMLQNTLIQIESNIRKKQTDSEKARSIKSDDSKFSFFSVDSTPKDIENH